MNAHIHTQKNSGESGNQDSESQRCCLETSPKAVSSLSLRIPHRWRHYRNRVLPLQITVAVLDKRSLCLKCLEGELSLKPSLATP